MEEKDEVAPYEEWTPGNKDTEATYYNVDTGPVDDLYAQPDMSKKLNARQAQSDSLCLVDNDLYSGGTDNTTYVNTTDNINGRPDTVYPPNKPK